MPRVFHAPAIWIFTRSCLPPSSEEKRAHSYCVTPLHTWGLCHFAASSNEYRKTARRHSLRTRTHVHTHRQPRTSPDGHRARENKKHPHANNNNVTTTNGQRKNCYETRGGASAPQRHSSSSSRKSTDPPPTAHREYTKEKQQRTINMPASEGNLPRSPPSRRHRSTWRTHNKHPGGRGITMKPLDRCCCYLFHLTPCPTERSLF